MPKFFSRKAKGEVAPPTTYEGIELEISTFCSELGSAIGKDGLEGYKAYVQILMKTMNNMSAELLHLRGEEASKKANKKFQENGSDKKNELKFNKDLEKLENEGNLLYKVTILYSTFLSMLVEGLPKSANGNNYTNRYNIWNFNICFPVICQMLLEQFSSKEAIAGILENNLLARLANLYQQEHEFKTNFVQNCKDIANKTWTILIQTLAKQMGNDFVYPSSQEAAMELFKEYDTYDAYIRENREVELKKLKDEVAKLDDKDIIKNVAEFCLQYFESTFKHKSVTMRFINYDDILDPHPDHLKAKKIVQDWLPTAFLDPDVVEYYMFDTILYDCCSYIYKCLPDHRLIAELGKVTAVALYLDGWAEVEPAFVNAWVAAQDFEIDGATQEELESWRDPKYNDTQNAALRAFIMTCRRINELGNCDITSAWKQFVININTIHNKKFKNKEEYLDSRIVDIALSPYNVVVAARFGHTLWDVPWEVNYPMLAYSGIENDMYSFGHENLDTKIVLDANSICLFKKFYPGASSQECAFMVEAIRDKHWEVIRGWRGTEYDHWYHICLSIGFTTLTAYRYSRAFIAKSKSTVLVYGR